MSEYRQPSEPIPNRHLPKDVLERIKKKTEMTGNEAETQAAADHQTGGQTGQLGFFRRVETKKTPSPRIRWAEDDDHPGVPKALAPASRQIDRQPALNETLIHAGVHHKDWIRPLVSTAILIAVLGFGAAGYKTYTVLSHSDHQDQVAATASPGAGPTPALGMSATALSSQTPAPEGAGVAVEDSPKVSPDRFMSSFTVAQAAERPLIATLVQRAQSSETANPAPADRLNGNQTAATAPATGPQTDTAGADTATDTGRTVAANAASGETAPGAGPASTLSYSRDSSGPSEAQSAISAAAPLPPVTSDSTASIAASVNMRSQASNRGSVMTVVPAGAMVALKGCDSWWCTITYNGQTGYVSRRFVNKSG